MAIKLLISVLSFVLICGIRSESSCFRNMEVVELPRFLLNNATSIRVSWDLVWDLKESENRNVRLTVKHLGYLSCQRGRRDYQEHEKEVSGKLEIIEDLHPYSSYKISLKLMLDGGNYSEATVTMETKAGVPQMRVRKSSLDYSHKDSGTKLYFTWRPPPAASQCVKFQSKLGFYHFEMKGLDKWNDEYMTSGEVPINETKLEVNGLQPFSHYALFVYITNTEGEYSRDFFIKLEKKTMPAQPQPPTHLTVETMDDQYHHLSWAEPFPPTGEIQEYNVRWRTNGTKTMSAFLGSKTVKPSNVLCEEVKKENIRILTKDVKKVCFTVEDLDTSEGYYFSVQAINKEVEIGSEWSVEVYSEPNRSLFELASSGTLAVVLVLSAIVMIVIIGALRTAYKVRNKLQFKQNIQHYFRDSTEPPESVRSDTTMMTYICQVTNTQAEIVPETEYATVGRPLASRKLSATPSQRSQQDPLPPLPPPLEDIPGYIRPNFDRPERLGSGLEEEDPPANVPIKNYFSHPTIHS